MERKEVLFRIKRWNPEKGEWFISEFKVPVYRGMTVLDALIYIKENLDPSLSFRASCRMAICGSCGMIINGKPRLACETQIFHLNSNVITVEPLRNYLIIKDLIADFDEFYEKYRYIKPYLIRRDEDEYWDPTREYSQTPEEHERYLQFSYCISCGLCVAACPTSGTNRRYLGPQALANTYRFIADSRDEGALERIELVDTPDGCWGCHLAGSCSDVCPKGVDPALAIQLLRRAIAMKSLGMAEVKKGAKVVPPLQVTEKKVKAAPPPFTVEQKQA